MVKSQPVTHTHTHTHTNTYTHSTVLGSSLVKSQPVTHTHTHTHIYIKVATETSQFKSKVEMNHLPSSPVSRGFL